MAITEQAIRTARIQDIRLCLKEIKDIAREIQTAVNGQQRDLADGEYALAQDTVLFNDCRQRLAEAIHRLSNA